MKISVNCFIEKNFLLLKWDKNKWNVEIKREKNEF